MVCKKQIKKHWKENKKFYISYYLLIQIITFWASLYPFGDMNSEPILWVNLLIPVAFVFTFLLGSKYEKIN